MRDAKTKTLGEIIDFCEAHHMVDLDDIEVVIQTGGAHNSKAIADIEIVPDEGGASTIKLTPGKVMP